MEVQQIQKELVKIANLVLKKEVSAQQLGLINKFIEDFKEDPQPNEKVSIEEPDSLWDEVTSRTVAGDN